MQGAYGGLVCILIYGQYEGSPEPPGVGVLLLTDETPILLTDDEFLQLT